MAGKVDDNVAKYVRTHLCPTCAAFLEKKALTDSDQRVYATWLYCLDCGWDQRHAKVSPHGR